MVPASAGLRLLGAPTLHAARLRPRARGVSFLRRALPPLVDPHSVLGVARGAQPQEIKEAYRRAALKTHPDTPEGSEVAFRRVAEAYDKLTNPLKDRTSGLRQRNGDTAGGPAARDVWGARTVRPPRAEDLFQKAFGRSVDEVLDEEVAKLGVALGVHGGAIREALFVKLLAKARVAVERRRSQSDPETRQEPASGSRSASAAEGGIDQQEAAVHPQDASVQGDRTAGVQHNTEPSFTREKLINVRGVPVIRVRARTHGPDGHVVETITDKPVYRV